MKLSTGVPLCVVVAAGSGVVNAASLSTFQTLFTLQQAEIPGDTVRSGPNRLAAAYNRYGLAVSDSLAKAAAKQNGTVLANPGQTDKEYLIPMTFGGQKMNIDLDTGSSDLWTYSSKLPAADRKGHLYYDPSKSSTSSVSNTTWSTGYADGSNVTGVLCQDTVNIGGINVVNQTFGLAETLSGSFLVDANKPALDGLMGMSLGQDDASIMWNLFAELDQRLFTADLQKGKPGSYDFGFINKTKYTGDILTIPATAFYDGVWAPSENTGYAIGSGNYTQDEQAVVLDTGTSIGLMPDDRLEAFYSQVTGAVNNATAGGWTLPCSSTPPTLTLGVGTKYRVKMPSSYLIYAPVEDGSETCFGALQSNDGLGFMVWGDAILKAQFIVFGLDGLNGGGSQLGFANKPLEQ